MLTRIEAAELCTLIDIATEGNWPQVVSEAGSRCDIDTLCNAVGKLADLAHVDVPFTYEDFEI